MKPSHSLHTELRSGLTTGTCASVVAKAAAYMLLNQELISYMAVSLPNGDEVVMDLIDSTFNSTTAQCTTVKDGGDDADVTHGIHIIAKASFIEGNRTVLRTGVGIGLVTKPGLAIEIGQPAINPTPLKMIYASLKEVIPDNRGVEILLSIPQGEEVAKRTFNPKLGITGGISILGTSGIVKPMSEEALKDSLVIKLRQLAAYGYKNAIFSPGNYGQSFTKREFELDEDKTVLTSNFIGFMLEKAVLHQFKKIVLVGHIGKLVKLAGGVFHTHSRVADARNEILAAHYFQYTKDVVGFETIMQANTCEEVVEHIHHPDFWNYFATLIKLRAEQYVYGELQVEVVLFSQKNGQLACTSQAITLINSIVHDK